jgi:hypothetical protein
MSGMDEARFAQLLEVYGADPERWPAAERGDAEALLAASGAARTLHAEAGQLDAMLGLVPAVTPSPALATRIVAQGRATVRRPRRTRRYLAVAFPLAAAASLALWLVRSPEPAGEVVPLAAVETGMYDVPSDALLAPSDLALLDADTWNECPDAVLGCLDLGALDLDSLSEIARGRVLS